VVTVALSRPPCVVSFSGGRDSSAVLAAATHVARRDGLELPVPVSLTFPECASADEHEWQAMVVRHLGLPDWQRLTFHDELDIIGPVASGVLRRHGALWPFNAHFHVPIMDIARGGSVLSGVFGDELLSAGWAWRRENLVLQRAAPPRPADGVRALVALGPAAGRAAFLRARARRTAATQPTRPPWLRPAAFEAVLAERSAATARESLSLRRSVRQALWPLRSRVIGQRSMNLLARDRDVHYVAPFAQPEVVASLIRERGWRMFASRTAAMDALFGDLLPGELAARSTKAWFDTAFFHRHARAFAGGWDGSGVDPAYVDVEELRRGWIHDPEPDARTYSLLQQAWLLNSDRSAEFGAQ
jgi:asparagine synthase (glutamine-hydrolysing)